MVAGVLPCFERYEPSVSAALERSRQTVKNFASGRSRQDHCQLELPELRFSLMSYLPFWINERTSNYNVARVLCELNAVLLYANWIIDPVMDVESQPGIANGKGFLPLTVLIGSWAGAEAAQIGAQSELVRWFNVNTRALEREYRKREAAFVPYCTIWRKMAIAMASVEILYSRSRFPDARRGFQRFFAHYQMMDEYVDFFDDFRTGSPNQLNRIFEVDHNTFHQDFWSRYATHGESICKWLLRDAAYFKSKGLESLSEFCLSRSGIAYRNVAIARDMASAADAATELNLA